MIMLCLWAGSSWAQTIRRVNPDRRVIGPNIYRTIQNAVNAANPNDIIHIEAFKTIDSEGATNSYYEEDIVINKTLTIIGNGYSYDNPELDFSMFDRFPSMVKKMEFVKGSEGSTLKNLFVLSVVYIRTSDITIESCELFNLLFLPQTNDDQVQISEGKDCHVKKCFIRNLSGGSNIAIDNTFVKSLWGITQSPIKNCYIAILSHIENSSFINSIFDYQVTPSQQNKNYANSYSHCLSLVDDLPDENSNVSNLDWAEIFSGVKEYETHTYEIENNMVLPNNSVAKGVGLNGEDIGIYGGSSPYKKSGVPNHPLRTYLLTSTIGYDNINLNVKATFKVYKNEKY